MAEIRRANGHRFEGPLPLPQAGIDPAHRPQPESLGFDLEAAAAAVPFLRSEIPEDAFTAAALGTEREGNGILIDDGLVLTIGYLIAEAEAITLTDAHGRKIRARAVAYDQESGFGLVRACEPLAATPIPRGSLGPLAVGESLIVVAYGGSKNALAATLVGKRAFAGYWEYLLEEAAFTAPPHPHWSGAALLDRSGRLCGVGSLFVQDAHGDGTGSGNMFVPIDLLEPILVDLLTIGRSSVPPRPWLGMFTSEVGDGLIVAGIVRGGPAHRAGIRIGDAVLGVEGRPVAGLADMYRRVWSCGAPGTVVRLQLAREGRRLEAAVRTGNRYDRLKPPAGRPA